MIETYQPSKSDIERLRPKAEMLKVSGDGVFATLQGEGITAGLPVVFLRLHYCNLTCGDPDGWQCDTAYTWDKRTAEYWQEPEDWSYEEISSSVEKAWISGFGGEQDRRLVITGGEPLIQQKKIAKLLDELPGWNVEIETNGTIMPIPELYACQFNCSPKLANSGNPLQERYKPEVLRVINSLTRSQFKFVAEDLLDLDEITQIVADCQLDPDKILVMPEGQTAEAVEIKAGRLRSAVESRGWKITMRNQLVWYGPKRRT
ncbi:MAG: 7-carboxy-7-deazaguanine synthase QueE [Candidatus Heimdallarchaeaceae archaeon]